MSNDDARLALEGGSKLISENMPLVGFGAELIGEEEEKNVLDAIRGHKLCRITHTMNESYAYRFEQNIQKLSGAKHVLAVNSCASALHVAMVALGIGPGDEVLVSGVGWFAVASVVINVGAVPVPVEFDETMSMDPTDIEHKITPRTKALIIIHWRGLPADMDRIMPIAQKYGLKVVEDVAQSFGGTYKGKFLGTFGDIGCYSFNMHKVVTAGEGGAMVMHDETHYKRSVSYSGMYTFYRHVYQDPSVQTMPRLPMLNFRIPETCAAMGFAQLAKLDTVLSTFRARNKELVDGLRAIEGIRLAHRYDAEGDCAYTLPLVFPSKESADFFYNAMKAEGAVNLSNLDHGFGGAEARGTAALVASQGMDPSVSGKMVLSDSWLCMTEQVGPTEKSNPWKMPGAHPAPLVPGVVPKSKEKLSKIVAFKINVLMESKHTALLVKASQKVAQAMRERNLL